MSKVLDKSCSENQNTHFIFHSLFLRKSEHTFYISQCIFTKIKAHILYFIVYFYENQNTHFIFHSIFLRKSKHTFYISQCIFTKINTHILYFILYFYENRNFYQIMGINVVEPGRQQTTVWFMRNPCWIPKPTNTLSRIM